MREVNVEEAIQSMVGVQRMADRLNRARQDYSVVVHEFLDKFCPYEVGDVVRYREKHTQRTLIGRIIKIVPNLSGNINQGLYKLEICKRTGIGTYRRVPDIVDMGYIMEVFNGGY